MSDLKEWLRGIRYGFLREVPGNGWCGITDMVLTWDLFCNVTESGYNGRYTYKTKSSAIEALNTWDGVGLPPGRWIHYHGKDGYYGNPHNPQFARWLGEVLEEANHEMSINWRTAWRYFELGLTPLQYYFQVWMFENVVLKPIKMVGYVYEDHRMLWALVQEYFGRCSKLSFGEIVTGE